MTNTRTRTALVLAAVLIGASGCGGTPPSAPATTAGGSASMSMEPSSPAGSTGMGSESGTASAAAVAITISNFEYKVPTSVAPGAEVTVTNMDTAEHTVTADDGSSFDVEVKENGGTATFAAPSQPGTYAFHCKYHSNMHGTLTVK
jgi:plastocyanin